MTPIQEATKEWFEMEGWEEGPAGFWMEPTVQGGNYPKALPTIDANYLFAVVAERIKELMKLKYPYKSGIVFNYSGSICFANFYQVTNGDHWDHFPEASGKSEVEAGLKSALAARKELGV